LRQGLDDPRNLTLAFVKLANAIDKIRSEDGKTPCFILFENVPGILSDKTNAFGNLLAGLVGADEPFVPAGKWSRAGVAAGPQRVAAWRIVDAQFFGVAQRRRRVFVLARGGTGAWAVADALLPLGESMQRDPPSRGASRQAVAASVAARTRGGGGPGTDAECDGALIPALSLIPFDPLQITSKANRSTCTPGVPMYTLPAAPAVAYAVDVYNGTVDGDLAATLGRHSGQSNTAGPKVAQPITAFPWQLGGTMQMSLDTEVCGSLVKNQVHAVHAVRRLTPRECERLQGFPDDYTAIPGAKDGPRYKALGNSMAVPVMRWIGERIEKQLRKDPAFYDY
jgi:DNA (cytosine-5)-methyltransferase 1